MIEWITKLNIDPFLKVKAINTILYFSRPGAKVYLSTNIEKNPKAVEIIKNIIKELKQEGRSYATCFDAVEMVIKAKEKQNKIMLKGWERVLRSTWDEI
jgi:ABC-type branched-subunit amino acid transport system substrate-binding protein